MTDVSIENKEFARSCRQPHRKVRRCFMTGKTCVHDEAVEQKLRDLESGRTKLEGFMVIPFRPNLNAFYDWSLTRFFRTRYEAETEVPQRSDQIRRTGYVICEKICRRIQEAAFVVVDISVDNVNVFYEFGIAYGLQQKLIIIHDSRAIDAELLKKRYLAEDMMPKVYGYPSIKPISSEESFVRRIYRVPDNPFSESRYVPTPRVMVLDLRATESEADAAGVSAATPGDIGLSFMDVVKGAVGVSIDDIISDLELPNAADSLPKQYLEKVSGLRNTAEIGPGQNRFETIRSEIDRSFCVLIRTSQTHPFSYFWLGYCHAVGKNVIPIYEVEKAEDRIDDLAFDIRSLWHLVLIRREPTRIMPELKDILRQMIITDFGEWSRKGFWSRIFGRAGRISIFTGALHNNDLQREMVGDWDLRTASELMSYFSSHQQVATIESPIYQREYKAPSGQQYLGQLRRLLRDRNAVVIASPDVNPMTEMLLGKLYGVDDDSLFGGQFDADAYPVATAAVKVRKGSSQDNSEIADRSQVEAPRFFFIEEPGIGLVEKRGFRGNWLPGKQVVEDYLGQVESKDEDFELYAHLVVALNPFVSQERLGEAEAENFVVILNGISGPSTFALTQLLTGGMGGEFVDYGRRLTDSGRGDLEPAVFNPGNEAESILSDLLAMLENDVGTNKSFCGVQAIVKVTVGPPQGGGEAAFDNRRVKRWRMLSDTIKLIEKRPSQPSSSRDSGNPPSGETPSGHSTPIGRGCP